MNSRLEFRALVLQNRHKTYPNLDNIFDRTLTTLHKVKDEFDFKYDGDHLEVMEHPYMGFCFFEAVHWFSNNSIKCAPHDLTFYWLTSRKEQKIWKFFRDVPEDLGNLTPDLIFEEDGIYHIIEFGTRKLSDPSSMKSYVEIKMKKYSSLINWLVRSGRKVQFDCIIVSRCCIVSTIPMPDRMVAALCLRYMTALSMLEFLKYSHPSVLPFLLDPLEAFNIETDMSSVMEALSNDEENILRKYKLRVKVPEACHFDKWTAFRLALHNQKILNVKQVIPDITMKDVIAEGGREDNCDSISRLPFAIAEKGDLSVNDISHSYWCDMPDHLREIWLNVLAEYNCCPDSYQTFQPTDAPLEHQLTLLQHVTKDYKKYRNRINLVLNHDTKERLATLGVGGKHMRNNNLVRQKRQFSQKHFHWSTNTDDIQDFINQFPDMIEELSVEEQTTSLELLDLATPKTNWPPMQTYQRLADNVYETLIFMSTIARELACSAAQSCKPHQFILKRIPSYQCLLLIKPTRSDENIFFSLLMNVRTTFEVGNLFPKPIKLGQYSVFDFKSVNFPWIETVLRLPEMYLAIKYMAIKSKALMKNLAAGLLIALDNKADAEEVFTKCRYIYMKGIQLPKQSRRPWDVLSGLPKYPRSRLTVFLIKRSIMLCQRVLLMTNLGVENNDEVWINIPNFVSDDEVSSWEDVLSIMYTGYFRNKNSYMSKNQSLAMVEKIIAPELEFQHNEEYKAKVEEGISSCPNKMEWNSGFLLYCINRWEQDCSSRGIKQPKSHITDEFLKQLGRVRVEDLATLKASNVDLEEKEYVEGYKSIPRKKLLLVLKDEILNFGPTLETALPHAINLISNRGGTMMISLFKKPQHGGLREIYVMDLASRIVQYCVEMLGRIICSTMRNEAMSHTEVKTNYRHDHMAKVHEELNILKRKRLDASAVTVSDNDDAEKWNQYQYMNKFAFMLIHMTDERLHPFVRISLSQWLNKRIRLEDTVLRAMANGVLKSNSPDITELIEGFRGLRHTPIIDKGMCDVKVQTGMMQGLLHFTSSALHALAMLGYEHLIHEYIRAQLKALNKERNKSYMAKLVTNYAITSDDSVCINTLISDIDLPTVISNFLTGCTAMKLATASLLGIMSSKKKASYCTAPISEFNSQWMDRNEVIRPKVRHILACFTYASMGNFLEQMDNMASLRQQALESGVPIHHISFINFLQGLYFYRLLGSASGSVFDKVADFYKILPDPNSGFFLIDPPTASGIVSTDFNAYCLADRFPMLGAKYSYSYRSSDMMVGSSGSLRSATCLSIEFSNMRRYMGLMKEINKEEIAEYLKEHPDLLYRSARNEKESSIQISIKLMQPNVLKSLSRDFSVMARELSASVYILWAPLVRPNSAIMNQIMGLPDNCEKRSIAQVIVDEIPPLRNMVSKGEGCMSEITRKWFFPLYKQFDMMRLMIAELETRIEQLQKSDPKSATSVDVFEGKLDEISLLKLCAYRWFNLRDPWTSTSLYDILWNEAKELYPFIHDTHDMTLESNQIDKAQKLKIILDRTEKKGKVIHPISRGGRAVRSSGLITFISYNFKEGVVLKPKDHFAKDDALFRRLRRITMCLQLPISDTRKERIILSEINKVDYELWKTSLRFSPLCLLHKNNPTTLTMSKVIDICRGTNSILGSWVIKQHRPPHTKRRKEWTGRGVWSGIFCSHNRITRVVLTVQDKYLTKIQTNNLDSLTMQRNKLLRLLDQWDVHPVIAKRADAAAHFISTFEHASGTPVFVDSRLKIEDSIYSNLWKINVVGTRLTVTYDNTPIYEFTNRSDLIQESYDIDDTDIINMILDNVSIPSDIMTDFLMTNFNDDRSNIQDWIKEMIRKRNPYNDPDYFTMPVIIPYSEVEEGLDELFSTFTGDVFVNTEAETEIANHCLFDEEQSKYRVFEAIATEKNIVSIIHFNFLRKYIDHGLVLVNRVNQQGYVTSEEEKFVFNLFTGEQKQVKKRKPTFDFWEEFTDRTPSVGSKSPVKTPKK
uniref:RNA-dependent RNA polymerase n=1 Tax=Hubei blood fluke virus 2 TaxID=1922840 RepID=A0A1L3KPE9_9VIRU|nr:RNA-dependent RNA polymerase [Hubei blood fluke virus 2]APG79257.1 RNA-dependent RNA polymerase [Hubei blood fluke virus 2]APG79279.1 RNA-dependent RNA polymerase [Hubei blood fluke virus 2]